MRPTTAAGLVQKYTLVPTVWSDWGGITTNKPLHGSFQSVSRSTLQETLGTFALALSNESNFNVIYDFGLPPSSKQENWDIGVRRSWTVYVAFSEHSAAPFTRQARSCSSERIHAWWHDVKQCSLYEQNRKPKKRLLSPSRGVKECVLNNCVW